MPSAIILGAGIAGVCTALSLNERGWRVTLIDRRGVGQETSFGNAGIIQADMPEPYMMPRSLRALAIMASGRSNDVHFRARELPRHLAALGEYWWNSSAARQRRRSPGYARLVATATREHQRWITAAGAEQLIRREGYRVMFRNAQALDGAATEAARLQQEHALPYRLLSAAQLAQAEPGLRTTGVGALQYLGAWTVSDPGGLVAAYGEAFVRSGGHFCIADGTAVRKIAGGWSVRTAAGAMRAEHLVVALGPWSPQFLKRFGGRVRMLYKRGYHIHVIPESPLNLTLIDASNAYVLAPMKEGIRITTGVQIASMHSGADPVQLTHAETAARLLLNMGERREAIPWMGTRPFMPQMLPVVGRLNADASVWVNFGHGHQGLTLGPSTGRMLAELMNGERPFVDPAIFTPLHNGL